ncbi:MAG: hypothetical protein PUP92_38725 [Rhizonema sp. PD38]|nr:hypothetical protein [Rhizonema sp. PD38]
MSITWNGGVEIPPGLDTAGMSVRIADVWALYQVFFGMDKSIKKDDSTEQHHPTPIATVSPATERNVMKPKGFLEMPEKL